MNPRLQLLALTCLTLAANAAVPPPEKLLPADTLGVVTIPDFAKARSACDQSATSQLWQDPLMKPFKDKLVKKVIEEWIEPLEKQLGIKLADYAGLAQGQITVAVVQNGWQGSPERLPAWLVLVDSRDKSSQLRTNIAELKKKWADAGRKSKTEKIRDIEFVTLLVSGDDLTKTLEKALPEARDANGDKTDGPGKKPDARSEITFGQSDSLLIVCNDVKVIEKVLACQAGSSIASLAEQAVFDADYQARLRNALAYVWIHFKPIADVLTRLAAEESRKDNGLDAVDPTKVMAATGIGALKAVSIMLNETPEGTSAELHVGVPASARTGVFKIITAETKDANPPPFVSADTVKFQRWRLDIPKAWAALERMITDIFPTAGGALNLMFQTAGKDKDPNFDLKRELLGNLGDDLITFEKSPRGNTLAELNSPPTLFLIGSPNADKLIAALKATAALLPPQLAAIKEREFLGRKIHSLPLPPTPNPDGSVGPQRNLSYAAGGGYLAMSTDDAVLEAYLRSSEGTGKSLREVAGLNEAAQKVGGMSTGLFGYENQSETMRATLEALKNDSGSLERILGMTPLGAKLGEKGPGSLKEWVDFSLLPSFDSIAKYFHFVVYSGSATADGLSYKMYSPTPPQLKR